MPIFTFEFHSILFFFFTFLWIIEFIVFKPHFKGLKDSDKQSFRPLIIVIFTIILGTISYNHFSLFIMPEYTFIYFNYFGIFLYFIGLLLRYYTRFTLGQYSKRDFAVSKSQELVSHGPYRVLAHPLYLGLFLLVLTVPVYFGQIVWIVASLVFFGKVILSRMKTEEKALEETYKKNYTAWLKKRYRFIPWIY